MSNYPTPIDDASAENNAAKRVDVYDKAGSSLAKAATSARQTIKSTKEGAVTFLENLDKNVEAAIPGMEHMEAKASLLARSSLQSMSSARARTYKSAHAAKEAAVGYLRRKPAQGIVMSAALGAVLVAVLNWRNKESKKSAEFR